MITQRMFGTLADGSEVKEFTFSHGEHELSIIEYGAIWRTWVVPNKQGGKDDLVLGFEDLDAYVKFNAPYMGVIAGRYANRIARGHLTLGGKTYQLECNWLSHQLHGGSKGFDKVLWKGEITGENTVSFSYLSPDGEGGYPGNLRVKVHYTYEALGRLSIEYEAETDQLTVVNLTNHAYFNLSGNPEMNIHDHVLTIHADTFTDSDEDCIPSGRILSVSDSPMDFRVPTRIGDRILSEHPYMMGRGGFDHNFVLGNEAQKLVLAARVEEPESGRILETYTTQPGLQLYTANGMQVEAPGKQGMQYASHAGFCLEAQDFPDAPHHANFPTTTLAPGEKYQQTTQYLLRNMT